MLFLILNRKLFRLLRKSTYLFFFLISLGIFELKAQKTIQTDIVVVGGGVGGTAAGISAARMKAKVILTEETSWLGGMMTAAGVSAFDGNHNLPSGIWAEFRSQLYKVYGGPGRVSTGWVSNTLFEPHVGDSILKTMAGSLPNLSILYHHRFESVLKKGNQVTGVVLRDLKNNSSVHILAKQVIDATELGDVLAASGAGFDLGMEASAVTGENINIPETNDIVQDLTYVAILKDYGSKADCTIVKPQGYDPAEFDGACTDYYFNKERKVPTVDAQKMLNYGKLPNNKYMLNWPGYGNDIYLNIVTMNHEKRIKALEDAKQMTLRYIYFIQHQLGFKHLGLADDEFPTKDRLALIPYHREGRRVKGLVRFKIKHISTPYEEPLYRTGIAVGDYPIDHHHKKNPNAPQHLDFYPVPSFTVPLGALIPQHQKGLIVAEKGVSVSNIVNGTTRLQPCVMLIGQAAGVLAALAVQQNKQAAEIPVRSVQDQLLKNGAYIMPLYDVRIDHPHFEAAQKIAATGLLTVYGKPSGWANQTLFYPDSLVETTRLLKDLDVCGVKSEKYPGSYITVDQSVQLISELFLNLKRNTFSESMVLLQANWQKWGFGNWDGTKNITRIQLAKMLNEYVDPFAIMQVNHQGKFELKY